LRAAVKVTYSLLGDRSLFKHLTMKSNSTALREATANAEAMRMGWPSAAYRCQGQTVSLGSGAFSQFTNSLKRARLDRVTGSVRPKLPDEWSSCSSASIEYLCVRFTAAGTPTSVCVAPAVGGGRTIGATYSMRLAASLHLRLGSGVLATSTFRRVGCSPRP